MNDVSHGHARIVVAVSGEVVEQARQLLRAYAEGRDYCEGCAHFDP